MASSQSKKRWFGWAAIASIAAGGVVWLVYPEPAPVDKSVTSGAGFEAFDSPRAAHLGKTRNPQARDAGGDASASTASTRREFNGTVMRPPPLEPASSLGSVPDVASPADAKTWQDPVNQRVLGQKSWMAEVPDATSAALNEELDRERPPRYPYDLRVRRSGIELTQSIVEGCYERLVRRRPQATGRLAVGYHLTADGAQARFKDVDILVKVRLDDDAFDECILDGLSRASFETTEEGVMWVEYPFVFEE